MTRVLVGDAHRQRSERHAVHLRGEILGHISDAAAEGGGTFPPLGVVFEQVRVRLEVRAATGRVHQNEINAGPFERRDVPLGEVHRRGAIAGMRVQRAAARLRRDIGDRDPRPSEHARGRAVDVPVGNPHDAAEQQRDPPSRVVDGDRTEAGPPERRRKLVESAQPR